MIVRSSYLHNEISYTGKMTSLYRIRAQAIKNYDLERELPVFTESVSLGKSHQGKVPAENSYLSKM